MVETSKTQIDHLGDQLRKSPIKEEDLEMLDEYRKSFGLAYEEVVGIMQGKLNIEPTGRPAKSTSSIIDKLRREKIRLSQMQDIAGCRVIVADIRKQNEVVALLQQALSEVSVVDRRVQSSHGYRAVHVIAAPYKKLIEIQVRTELQHGWAELSEKLADKFSVAIKYGGGRQNVQDLLMKFSEIVRVYEFYEERRSIQVLGKLWGRDDTNISDMKNEISKLISGYIKIFS